MATDEQQVVALLTLLNGTAEQIDEGLALAREIGVDWALVALAALMGGFMQAMEDMGAKDVWGRLGLTAAQRVEQGA